MTEKKNYNNEAYKDLITSIISDAFYVEGVSYDSKMHSIRRYTEIILRRLLAYPINKSIMIGDENVRKKLEKKGYTEQVFLDAIETIRNGGNRGSHTKELKVAEKKEYEVAVQALFDLYGYLFFCYFKKNEFGSNPKIVTAFSILPPIIRENALEQLYKEYPNNMLVIDKLMLAKIKAYDFETAEKWLDDNKESFQKYSLEFPEEEQEKLIERFGIDVASVIINSHKETTLYDEILKRSTALKDSKYVPLYTNFEEANSVYKEEGIVEGNGKDVVDFNDLMEFVYIGRREAEKQCSEDITDNPVLEAL